MEEITVDKDIIEGLTIEEYKSKGLTMEKNVSKGLTEEQYKELSKYLYECEIKPNELLYFPPMWMHATLNTDIYNIFMSLFIDIQLMNI